MRKNDDSPQNNQQSLCQLCKSITNQEDADDGMIENDSFVHDSHNQSDEVGNEEQSFLGLTNPNSNANKIYKQRMIEYAKMTERVGKVEKLLAANLESMNIQQKQHDQVIEELTKSSKDKQIALDAVEKKESRDKMIIKFREQRISELENKLAKAKNGPDSNDTE